MRKTGFGAFFIPDDRKEKIGVVHHGKGLVGPPEDFGGEPEHAFLRFRKRVTPAGFQTFHRQFVEPEFGGGGELFEFLFVDPHDFRFEPGGLPFDFGGAGEDAVHPAAVLGMAGVLVRTQMGKGVELLKKKRESILRPERFGQRRRRIRKVPFEFLKAAEKTADFPEVFFPLIRGTVQF